MDIQHFIEKTPYLYHLTDRCNLDFIKESKKLFSTVQIIKMAEDEDGDGDSFLRTRRPKHSPIKINGFDLSIRDQRPLNKALERCLTDNWTAGDFILHLNRRVFFWPSLKRLRIHYGRYASENPIILRFSTKQMLELNKHAEITNINSGATRPSGALGGKAAARGKNTFKKFENFDLAASKVAEVTFPEFCCLPDEFFIGNSPEGPWRKDSL